MHAFDITLTDAEYERFSSIHTTVGGTLSAAIIAGMLVIFIKLYDNYNNKTMRDLKDALDIAKESERLPKNGQKSIQYLIETRTTALVEKAESEKLYMSQPESFRDRYTSVQMWGMISIYLSIVLALIVIALALAQVIGNSFWGLGGSAGFFLIVAICCSRKIDSLKKEMSIEATEHLPLKEKKLYPEWWSSLGKTIQCLLKSAGGLLKSIFAKRGTS